MGTGISTLDFIKDIEHPSHLIRPVLELDCCSTVRDDQKKPIRETLKVKKWKDLAGHRAGCPYKGVAVFGSEAEMAKHYSRYCPGCNNPVKWEEQKQEKENAALNS